ncbi:MAG: hypothetical protein NTU97_02215, partial [Candidatus Magasanikbacteria bacterium]|nr:hypothetical protein [Candidatus Magasanikbacteria bacterium]
MVSPIVYTTSTLGATLNNLYDATPLDTSNICVSLTNTYDWRWNPSDGTNTNLTPSNYCSVSNKTTGAKVSGLDQDLQIKKQPTTRAETITATWNDDPEHTLFANTIKGTAYLNLVPQRPKIVEYYPNCNSACTNAAVGFKFDIPVQYGNNFSFLKCDNSTCSSYSWVSNSYNFTD